MRAAVLVLFAGLALAACGETRATRYSVPDVKAAYFKPHDGGPAMQGYFQDPDDHAHTNYVPFGGLEVCPLVQRASYTAPALVANAIEPTAAEPVQQFVVAPKEPDDTRTPTITQGALVFGTNAIAASGMSAVDSGMEKCPTSYEVRGGPSPILGTYGASSRPIEISGWKGRVQQIAHTYPPGQDNVYYEDLAHVVVGRGNVILYVDVTHEKIIGERADATATAERVLKTVLKRLG
jgi:hypothetical protein